MYWGSSILYSPRIWQKGSLSLSLLHQFGRRVWLSSKILSIYASRICKTNKINVQIKLYGNRPLVSSCTTSRTWDTYSELCYLDGAGYMAKYSSLLVHCKDKCNTCCWFPITVNPFILFRNRKQNIERNSSLFSLD